VEDTRCGDSSLRTSDFTRDLDELSRKHGLVLVGARVAPIDLSWNGPDAEKWAQYAITDAGILERGFWDARLREGGP
jgi:hypothetical protein